MKPKAFAKKLEAIAEDLFGVTESEYEAVCRYHGLSLPPLEIVFRRWPGKGESELAKLLVGGLNGGDPAELFRGLTDEAVFKLHEDILQRTLHTLGDSRVGEETRQSIFQWIASNDEQPFSFVTCARVCGCDPDELRERLFFYLRRQERRNTRAA
ncbi:MULTISPECIES: hypothetical protein [unclassified Methylocaldum]|jgi:hypothetical protein|uniref:hypothetical protein n=1 Tax=unclassified Methylocaldum TaxID=2622260 RepID=UPI000A3202AF|nr:hypothetical protein [Methylocaldum sp. RMAD-M]MBP1153074.1 hypothetical protein [Methylocaldum sp. RMAD-M]MVF24146.1 hypothetical protein [Methylocaldum sp. BRCS4]